MGVLTPQFGAIVPAPNQQLLASNYLSFTDGTNDFAQQYLPEIYEQEVQRYGNRTLSGFLRMVGAEMPMASDQVIWSEQGRLHLAYNATVADINDPADGGSDDGSGGGTLTIGIISESAEAEYEPKAGLELIGSPSALRRSNRFPDLMGVFGSAGIRPSFTPKYAYNPESCFEQF